VKLSLVDGLDKPLKGIQKELNRLMLRLIVVADVRNNRAIEDWTSLLTNLENLTVLPMQPEWWVKNT